MSNFEKFTQKKFKSDTKPLATITKSRLINFNVAAMKNIVKDFIYAILYYDRKNSLVGIKFTNKSAPEAYKIKKYRQSKLGNISAIAFLRYYQIEHFKTVAYTIGWDEEEKMAIIDLKEHAEKVEEEIKPNDEIPF